MMGGGIGDGMGRGGMAGMGGIGGSKKCDMNAPVRMNPSAGTGGGRGSYGAGGGSYGGGIDDNRLY